MFYKIMVCFIVIFALSFCGNSEDRYWSNASTAVKAVQQ